MPFLALLIDLGHHSHTFLVIFAKNMRNSDFFRKESNKKSKTALHSCTVGTVPAIVLVFCSFKLNWPNFYSLVTTLQCGCFLVKHLEFILIIR